MVAPEPGGCLAQVIAGGVAGRMVGHGGGEDDVQAGVLGATLDFLAPIGVDFAGKVNVETHRFFSFKSAL